MCVLLVVKQDKKTDLAIVLRWHAAFKDTLTQNKGAIALFMLKLNMSKMFKNHSLYHWVLSPGNSLCFSV